MRAVMIPNVGELARRVEALIRLLSPILEQPAHSFDWRLGDTATRGFAGVVGGQWVAVFVAKEGPHRGKVVSAFIPDANQRTLMGLE